MYCHVTPLLDSIMKLKLMNTNVVSGVRRSVQLIMRTKVKLLIDTLAEDI